MFAFIRIRCVYIHNREVPIFRIMRKKSPTICNPRTADSLSPYHDSQYSAFSTEALIRNNQGTTAVVLLWPALAGDNGT